MTLLLKESTGNSSNKVTLLRESIPRQVDKKSEVSKEEKGVWGSQGGDRGLEFSRRRKGQNFFLQSLVLGFFSLSPELMITQQKNSA